MWDWFCRLIEVLDMSNSSEFSKLELLIDELFSCSAFDFCRRIPNASNGDVI